jgi:outer membrane protein insertion porin family
MSFWYIFGTAFMGISVARGNTIKMRVWKLGVRGLITLLLLFAAAPLSALIGITASSPSAWAQSSPVIRSIKVQGNRRVEPETVRSYLQFSAGSRYNALKVDESLKSLFATGLFSDVRIGRQGNTVMVKVVENPIVRQVVFEGNSEIDNETLSAEVQLNSRAVFTRARVQADVQRILTVYRRSGRFAVTVEPKIIKQEHNRIDLIFEINEGPKTTVRSINFVGNESFTDSQLQEIVSTSETGLLSILNPTNIYDPDRLNLDRELLRQFYLKSGYADARVIAATADLDRDGQGFFISFTIEEGEQYKFGNIDIETNLQSLDPEAVRGKIETKTGKIYNASKIDKSLENITTEVSAFGYAFARVRPRVDRDSVARVISITYVIEEGPRVYIERIDIVGNVRTLDKVIRREFRLAEGDAYNRLLVDAARRRLARLQYFKKVAIASDPGSAPDRVIIVVRVQEQPTGELSFGGGYSSSSGAVLDISLSERNLLGRGQYVRLSARGGFESLNLDFSFTEPRFMGRNMSAGFDFFMAERDRSDESSFSSKNIGGGIRFGVPLNNDWQFGVGYRLVNEEIFDVQAGASPAIRGAEGTTLVSSISYTLAYDTRNHVKNPSQGIYFSVGQDLAGLGGDVNFIRTNADLRGFYPIRKKVVLAARIQGGHVAGYSGDDVRILDLFFKGSETIRGFDNSGIGPRDLITGDALGGKIFAASAIELRFPIPKIPKKMGLSAAVFFDAATVYDTGDLSGLSISRVGDDNTIRTAAGFSLIWESPLGPLRADLAQALTSERYDETQFFHFGAAARF